MNFGLLLQEKICKFLFYSLFSERTEQSSDLYMLPIIDLKNFVPEIFAF